MKPQLHANRGIDDDAVRSPLETRIASARGIPAASPPVVPHRRYPSLSDDGQPYCPRWRSTRRPAQETLNAALSSVDSDSALFSAVRVIAILCIIAIIASLVGGA